MARLGQASRVLVPVTPKPAGQPELEAALIREVVRGLQSAPFIVESESTSDYNCIAWAMGDCTRPWSPSISGGYYWPSDLPIGIPAVEVVEELFRRAGYSAAESPQLLPGIEKVAIYADEWREVRHAARQLDDGSWVSKMGDLADIRHDELEPVEGPIFGKVVMIMQRPRRT